MYILKMPLIGWNTTEFHKREKKIGSTILEVQLNMPSQNTVVLPYPAHQNKMNIKSQF